MNTALIQQTIFNSQLAAGGGAPTGSTAFILRARQRVYILPAHPRAQP